MIERFRSSSVYLDANVFIYAVEKFAAYEDVTRLLLSNIDDGRIKAATSELTLAEVLVGPIRRGRAETIEAFETALATRGSFEMVPISRGLLEASAKLRATVGLRLPDAIHVATAMTSGCRFFVSADRRLRMPGTHLQRVLLDDLVPSGNEGSSST